MSAPKSKKRPKKRPEKRPKKQPKKQTDKRPTDDDERPRPRRALSDQGGRVRTTGDRRVAEVLERAMKASGVERGASGPHDPDGLTHGFHTYPARMHRGVASVLIAEASDRGATVVDPFCGSGTVLVEALAAGRRAAGVDLSPLAVRLAEVKTLLYGERARTRLLRSAEGIAVRSEERVRARVDARAPIPRSEARWYGGHTLKELAGLFEEIGEVPQDRDRRALEMVFSSILIKVSRQQADTAEREATRRIRKGLPTELFLRRARELVDRLGALSAATPAGSKAPSVFEGDARRLRRVLPRGCRADLILSSPPYGGTWDYAEHHGRRSSWLGLDTRALSRWEIGARRHLEEEGAADRWDGELRETLESLASVLAPGGRIALLVGDAEVGRRRIAADAQLARIAPGVGLAVVATASQERRDRRGGRRRREHLIALSADRR